MQLLLNTSYYNVNGLYVYGDYDYINITMGNNAHTYLKPKHTALVIDQHINKTDEITYLIDPVQGKIVNYKDLQQYIKTQDTQKKMIT